MPAYFREDESVRLGHDETQSQNIRPNNWDLTTEYFSDSTMFFLNMANAVGVNDMMITRYICSHLCKNAGC